MDDRDPTRQMPATALDGDDPDVGVRETPPPGSPVLPPWAAGVIGLVGGLLVIAAGYLLIANATEDPPAAPADNPISESFESPTDTPETSATDHTPAPTGGGVPLPPPDPDDKGDKEDKGPQGKDNDDAEDKKDGKEDKKP